MNNRNAYIVCSFAALLCAFLVYMLYVQADTPLTKAQLEAQSHFSEYETERQSHVVFDAMSADPDANKYRGEGWHGKVFCGEVNIKNSHGGYNGWIPFSQDAADARRATGSTKANYGKFSMGWGRIDTRCGPMQP